MKRKDVILFVSIFCVLALIAGGTYAYWGWTSDTNKTVVFNTSKGIKDYFIYDSGDSHFVGNFRPSSTYCGGRSNTISFSKKTEVSSEVLTATIKMDVNKLGSNIRSSDYVGWAITSGNADPSACTGSNALHTGTFKNVANGSVITLETDIEVLTTTKTYTIWVWINENGQNLGNLSGETIDVNVWTQVDMTSND